MRPAQFPNIPKCYSTFSYLFVMCSYIYDKEICLGKADSARVRIDSTEDEEMQAIVKACGSELTKGFVDVS